MPLLIGGATTSRVHTAVKIHPNYTRGQAVYVTDASRAVGVVSSLLSPEAKGAYVETIRAEYRKVADAHARAEADKQRLPLDKARANALKIDWAAYQPPKPTFTGTRVFRSYDLAELVPYIDWTPFFQTWELKGRFPAILEDETQGAAARQLFDDAQAMLQADRRRALVQPEGGHRLLAGERGRRRHPPLHRREPRRRRSRPSTACASSSRKRDGKPNVCAGRFRRAGARAGSPTTSAASSSPPGIEEVRDRRAVRARQRRLLARSWSRRWPTASPRPSPSACTSACARSSGAMRRTRTSPTRS